MSDQELMTRNMLKLAGSFDAVLKGKQQSTVRLGVRPYVLGSGLLIAGREHLPIFILALEALRFGELEKFHALTAGLKTAKQLQEQTRKHYPRIKNDAWVTYVRFEPIQAA